MATAFIVLMAALAAIALITTNFEGGNARRRSGYYEENYKEGIPFSKRNLVPHGYQGRALAMPAHTQGIYDDTYAKAYNDHEKRKSRKSYNSGNQRLMATLLFSMLIIITLAYAAMRKKERVDMGPVNKAELYLKY